MKPARLVDLSQAYFWTKFDCCGLDMSAYFSIYSSKEVK